MSVWNCPSLISSYCVFLVFPFPPFPPMSPVLPHLSLSVYVSVCVSVMPLSLSLSVFLSVSLSLSFSLRSLMADQPAHQQFIFSSPSRILISSDPCFRLLNRTCSRPLRTPLRNVFLFLVLCRSKSLSWPQHLPVLQARVLVSHAHLFIRLCFLSSAKVALLHLLLRFLWWSAVYNQSIVFLDPSTVWWWNRPQINCIPLQPGRLWFSQYVASVASCV